MPPLTVPTTLRDELVLLRPLAETDAAAYAAAFADDPQLGILTGFEEDPTEESVRAYVEWLERASAEGTSVELAILDAASGDFLGALTLHSFHWRHRRAEIGAWVVRRARGRGVAQRACELAIGWCFGDLGLERIELTTIPENETAQRLALRLGFVQEGVLRDRCLERGRRVTELMFGLLREEG